MLSHSTYPPHPTPWKALADFSQIGETGRSFKILRHWIIHREETVKCHPAAQGAALLSLSFSGNEFYGLSRVFWFFSTYIYCMTLIPSPGCGSSSRFARDRRNSGHDLVPVNRRGSCQALWCVLPLFSLCCLLSLIKINVRPEFISIFLYSLLIFNVKPKTYLLVCFKGCGIYCCPPLTEIQVCNTIATGS